MGGMGKHIHDTRTDQAVTVLCNQNPGIPGQGSRIAGDINNTFRSQFWQMVQDFLRPAAGRIKQHFIE